MDDTECHMWMILTVTTKKLNVTTAAFALKNSFLIKPNHKLFL